MKTANQVKQSQSSIPPHLKSDDKPIIRKPSAKSIIYKIVGSAIILLSWVVQNYTFDEWDTKSKNYSESARDFSDMVRSSLLYESLYFHAGQSSNPNKVALQSAYIQQAAKKYALGLSVNTLNREIDKKDKIEKINMLISSLKSVKDFESFNEYTIKANEIVGDTFAESNTQIKNIENKRAIYKNVYLVAFILGTTILMVGYKYENS
jgi:hypothetical protein